LFDSYKEIFDEVKEAREMATKSCINIKNSSTEILEDFGIETMGCLEEASPSEIKLKYVTDHRDTSRDEINHLE